MLFRRSFLILQKLYCTSPTPVLQRFFIILNTGTILVSWVQQIQFHQSEYVELPLLWSSTILYLYRFCSTVRIFGFNRRSSQFRTSLLTVSLFFKQFHVVLTVLCTYVQIQFPRSRNQQRTVLHKIVYSFCTYNVLQYL